MRALVYFLVMVACSAAPRPPVDTPIAVAPAPSAPARPAPECTVDADCEKKARSKDTTAVCESNKCGAWSVVQLRAWAATTGFDVPESVPPPPKLADVAWIDRKKANTLYVDSEVFWPGNAKAKCVPITARFQEPGSLVALIAAKFGENPEGNGVTHYNLMMHEELILTGPGAQTISKGSVSGWGIGEARTLGRHLESPTSDALRYGGWRVRKSVKCTHGNLQIDPRCTPCERCIEFRLQDVSLEPMTSIGYKKARPALKASGDEPVCVACPAIDEKASKLRRFEPLTVGLVTLREGHEGPAFFRKLGDCEKDRKERAAKP